jgi:tetratricopeptide (TPR) repeat protein
MPVVGMGGSSSMRPGTRTCLQVGMVLCLCVVTVRGQQQTDSQALLQQGQALASGGRLAEAEAPLTRAAAQDPYDSRVLTLLAQVKGRLGEGAEAASLLRRVVEQEPLSAPAHLNLAIALADSGDQKGALEQVEHAIRLDPHNAQAHLNHARMLADAESVTKARAEFSRAMQLAPHDTSVALFAAEFEKDHGRPQAAVALLTKVVAQQTQNAQAYLLLGQARESLHQQDDAIAAWRHVIAINPFEKEALFSLSQALRQKEPAEAAELLQRFNQVKAEEQRTDRARELGNQGYAAMQQQKWTAAVAALQRAISVCGECTLKAGLHERLGLAECHSGDLDAGEKELRLALSLDPNDRTAVEALTWVASQRVFLQR